MHHYILVSDMGSDEEHPTIKDILNDTMYLQSPLIPLEVIKKVHPSFPLFENDIILPLSLCGSGLITSKPPNCSASV